MSQNYRIYLNQNTLTISENPNVGSDDVQFLDSQHFDFPTFFKMQQVLSGLHYFLHVSNADAALANIKSQVSVVEAAGGLVVNAAGDFLFIFRNGKWDLPKGKIELNEAQQLAAVREVEEECGVTVAKVLAPLQPTFHVYVLKDTLILKPTYWFSMYVEQVEELIPQIEEGITEVAWINPQDIPNKLKNTYPAILDVVKQAGLL